MRWKEKQSKTSICCRIRSPSICLCLIFAKKKKKKRKNHIKTEGRTYQTNLDHSYNSVLHQCDVLYVLYLQLEDLLGKLKLIERSKLEVNYLNRKGHLKHLKQVRNEKEGRKKEEKNTKQQVARRRERKMMNKIHFSKSKFVSLCSLLFFPFAYFSFFFFTFSCFFPFHFFRIHLLLFKQTLPRSLL